MLVLIKIGAGSYPQLSWVQNPVFWSCNAVPLLIHQSRCTWLVLFLLEGDPCTAA